LEMKDFKQTSRSKRPNRAPARLLANIPATFTEVQAETILAIRRICATDSGLAEQLIQAWTPKRFTDAQAQCIQEMLQLDADDLRATIADAMEPCDLRRRLRAPHEEEPASRLEVDAPIESERMGLDMTSAPPPSRMASRR
jgi:hypothetical protein